MEWYKLDGTGGGVSHDGAGRVTAEFNRTYTYDDFHSLVRAGAASGNNAQGFQYDGVGRLIAVRRGTAGWPVEEELAYDGTQMVAAWNGAGVATWSALWGQGVDNLISVKPGPDGAEVMALKDGRGSVVGYYQAEATPQGLLATADYTPEGRVTSKDWVTGTTCTETGNTQCPRLGGLPFGFHGAYKSPAHGLLYFRNRWYSAEAGQWLTQDPLGEVDSVNLYAFNRFDSVNFLDPFGLDAEGPADGHSKDGRDPNDPKLDGGAELDISVRAGGVDDDFIADMECKYLNKCTTGNLERLEQKGGWRQPSDVLPESPSSAHATQSRGRVASRASLVYASLLDILLAQVPKPKKQRVVLLLATNIDVVTAEKNHPQEGKNQRRLYKDFEKKLVNALSQETESGESPELREGDEVFIVNWNGKTIPKLPRGIDKVIAVSHGQARPGALLPQGGSGDSPEVSPREFVGQLTQALGGAALSDLMIMGCDTEKELADAVSSMMPQTHVRGSTAEYTLSSSYSFVGEVDPRAGDLRILPSDGIRVNYKVYDTRTAGESK